MKAGEGPKFSTAFGWGNPSTGKTSHFFIDGMAICGMTSYRPDWDGTPEAIRPLGTKQCRRCIRSLVARGKKLCPGSAT